MHSDLNDISAVTALGYPFLTQSCLSAQPVIWQERLPLTAPEGGREQIQRVNHITQNWRDMLLVPTRNVGSLNSIGTKQTD